MKYSVIIPLKNEAHNILPLIDELETVMQNFKESWELILIDDGSTDNTPYLLGQVAKDKSYIRYFCFDKNYGQSSAFDAGFKKSIGEVILTLDGDGQNDPADIPFLIKALVGADMVVGWRVERKDSFSKRLISRFSNFIRSRLCHDNIQDTGCSLKAYRRTSLAKIKMFDGLHRFLPALFMMEGFIVKQIPVNHRPRLLGKSNYNFFNRGFGTFIDLLAVVWMCKKSLHFRFKDDI